MDAKSVCSMLIDRFEIVGGHNCELMMVIIHVVLSIVGVLGT